MSNYMNNPNTKRLATNCIMCARPLCDARSVETGIGPVCRKRMGYDDMMSGIDEKARTQANKLVHRAGLAMDKDDVATILDCATEIRDLGLGKLAAVIRRRFIKIRIEREDGVQVYRWDRARQESIAVLGKKRNVIRLFTPYNPDFNEERKRMRLWGRPVKQGKSFHWEFGEDQGSDVMEILTRIFPGQKALGPKGVFTLPKPEEE